MRDSGVMEDFMHHGKDCYIQPTTSLRLTPRDQHKSYNGECSGPYRAALDILCGDYILVPLSSSSYSLVTIFSRGLQRLS